MRKPRPITLGFAGGLAAAGLTVGFWLSGVLSDAAQVTAYSTALLAIGTTGLATGAIGTYIEQRRVNQQQAIALEAGRINEIAQVRIERLSDAGEFATAVIRNKMSRAIRNVYVWVEVKGMTPRYQMSVKRKGPGDNDDTPVRGMEHAPRGAAGGDDLQWRMRIILPGDERVFEQMRFMVSQRLPEKADSDITAWIEFEDSDGKWWRCNEDGEVNPAPAPPPIAVQPHPITGQLP